jgi:hypothetical protein
MRRLDPRRGRTTGAVVALAALVVGGVVVASPAQAATPCTTVCYVSASFGNDANTGQQSAPFRTIQTAIDAVAPGGTVKVRPGTYSEAASARTPVSIPGTYDFGLFIGTDKAGITIQGVDSSDTPFTSAAAVAAGGPQVRGNSTASFGPVEIFVEGDNVTIQGIRVGSNLTDATGCPVPGTCTQGRAIESVGENFHLDSSVIEDFYGSVLLTDPRYDPILDTPRVTAYAVTNNIFRHGVSLDIASGPGGGPNGGPTSGRLITGNTFDGDSNVAACTAAFVSCATNEVVKPAVAFDGAGTAVPSFVDPVGPATMTGNTFGASAENIARFYGPADAGVFPWSSYFLNNTFGRAAVDTIDGNADNVRSISYGDFPSVDRIGGTLQAPHPAGCVVGPDCNGEIDNAQPGDVVLLRGTFGEQVSVAKTLTLRGAGAALTGAGAGTGVSIPGPGDVTVENLAVNGYAVGVAIAGGVAHVNDDAITANRSFGVTSTVPATDAHCNWWGSTKGPGTPGAAGSPVDANVDVGNYWLVSSTLAATPALTQLNCLPVVSIDPVASQTSVVEGSTGQHPTVTLQVTLTQPWSSNVTVDWTTADGTAPSATTSDHDYVAAKGTLTFLANSNSPQTITVTVNGDAKPELNESFLVKLSNPVNAGINLATQSITIQNDDLGPLKIHPLMIREGSLAKFWVNARLPYYQPIALTVTTSDGTAKAALGDYAPISGITIVIPANTRGRASAVQIPVAVMAKAKDGVTEGAETFHITVTSTSPALTQDFLIVIPANST